MTADPSSSGDLPRSHGHESRVEAALAGAILLVALTVRVVYAYDLPLNGDEDFHLREARLVSLRQETFYLPLHSAVTTHPLGVLYLTAVAHWVGGGNLLVIRLAFVALSLIGLIGLYVLGRSFFGPRVALVALSLAAVDRHLVASAGVFLESPAVIFLAPWTILLMRRCLNAGSARDWLLLGLLFGLGYWLSTLYLVLLLPFGLFVLASGKLVQVLKSPWMYAGVVLMVTMMLPPLIADLGAGATSFDRNVAKAGPIGLSPRGLLLYAGDLMMCLKDPVWIVENIGIQMYGPMYVPCNWLVGLAYLALGGLSLRFWRNERVLLLILVIVGVMIPVTLLDAREPWNEFTWASSTVYVAVLLSAFVLDRTWAAPWGKVATSAILAYATGSTLFFLAGPKWGYFCPDWERAYIGQHAAINLRAKWNPEQFPSPEAIKEMRNLAGDVIERHPDCVIAWFFLGQHARSAAEQRAAYRRVLALDPTNRLVFESRSHDLMARGDWVSAKKLLEQLASQGDPSVRVCTMLAEAEYRLGNFGSAVAWARRVLEIKPEDEQIYRILYFAYDALGDSDQAEAALRLYVAKCVGGPAAAYLTLAKECFGQGKPDKGREFLEAALRGRPLDVKNHTRAGILLATELDDMDRAIGHFQAAARLAPASADVHYNLGYAMEMKGDSARAIEYYEKSLQMAPNDGNTHIRLGNLLARQARMEEAKEHFEKAKRLGFEVPALDESLPEAKPLAGDAR